MKNSIIQVQNISKSYIISHEGEKAKYTSLRDVVAEKAKKIFHFAKSTNSVANYKAKREEFFALNDVNFNIEAGDRIGIIGRNGAGKSTLLKILSRITEPTSGQIKIRGRVASLLEVGTGFHPELTGRENIFLNGAILGMSRSEIKNKFDEIVAFAEVEKFLDTPVKRYSSGMYVRLAFAVAANLEPEILIVDEVLAVGDAQFQKKCLGKMEDVSKNEGRTVIFVSHQMDAIESLTQKCIYLKDGTLFKMGNTNEIVETYLSNSNFKEDINTYKDRSGNKKAKVVKIELLKNGKKINGVKQGESFEIVLGIESGEQLSFDISFVVENQRQVALFCTQLTDLSTTIIKNNYFEVKIKMEKPNLRQGDYQVSIALFKPDKSEFYDVVLHFPIITIEGIDSNANFPIDERWGNLYFPLQWEVL
jgi:lipopolysaccharide transport system ATP-binding protein